MVIRDSLYCIFYHIRPCYLSGCLIAFNSEELNDVCASDWRSYIYIFMLFSKVWRWAPFLLPHTLCSELLGIISLVRARCFTSLPLRRLM